MEKATAEKKSKGANPGPHKTIDIVLRCWHVAVMGVLFGGLFWGVPFERLMLWGILTVVSGACLAAHGFYKCRHWFYQGDGVMAECHVALIALTHVSKDLTAPALFLVVLFGVVGSHMPRRLRHYSFVHKRRID